MTYGQPMFQPAPGRPPQQPRQMPQQQFGAQQRPVVRGVRPEEKLAASAPIRTAAAYIPTPEELGIGATGNRASQREEVDWTQTRRQLQQVGAVKFQLENLPTGSVRFSCWLPEGSPSRVVAAEGATEAEAVRKCLADVRRELGSRQ